jgi:protein required for attachment to host cells
MPGKTNRTWALVINSAHCRVVRGVAAKPEDALGELVLETEAKDLREIMSDKPGRSFASKGGGRRSAIEYASDPVAEHQRAFIRQALELLESHRRKGDFDKLAVFAEHDMLGHLRQLMPKSLRDTVIREVPKNLLHLSEHELSEVVARELKNGSDVP